MRLETVVKFSKKELEFLDRNEVCRLATVSGKGIPHVVPVCYIFHEGRLYMAVDYGTKKLENLKKNLYASVVVDTYGPNRAIMIQGKAEIIERGPAFREIYALFHQQFSWVRRSPWKEGEAPFVRVKPFRKVSWGL